MKKFKAREQSKWKQYAARRVEKVENDSQAEIDREIKKCENKIDMLQTRHEQEIKIIRNQEQRKWQSVITEREQEIDRLRNVINENAKKVEEFKEREFQFEESFREAVKQFQRGSDKIADGVKHLLRGESKIDSYTNGSEKSDNKILKLIKQQ